MCRKEKEKDSWGTERVSWTLTELEEVMKDRDENQVAQAVEQMNIGTGEDEQDMETYENMGKSGKGGTSIDVIGVNKTSEKDVTSMKSVTSMASTASKAESEKINRQEETLDGMRNEYLMKCEEIEETNENVCGICENKHGEEKWSMECSLCWRWVFGKCLGFENGAEKDEAAGRYWTCIKCAHNARKSEEIRLGVRVNNEMTATMRGEIREIKEGVSELAQDMQLRCL